MVFGAISSKILLIVQLKLLFSYTFASSGHGIKEFKREFSYNQLKTKIDIECPPAPALQIISLSNKWENLRALTINCKTIRSLIFIPKFNKTIGHLRINSSLYNFPTSFVGKVHYLEMHQHIPFHSYSSVVERLQNLQLEHLDISLVEKSIFSRKGLTLNPKEDLCKNLPLKSYYLNSKVNHCNFTLNSCKSTITGLYLNTDCKSFPQLRNLRRLKALKVIGKGKEISPSFADSFLKHSSLRNLTCKFCGLKYFNKQVNQLVKLDLSFNKFKSMPKISGRRLTTLNLSSNLIEILNLPSFLSTLKVFDLSNNSISRIKKTSLTVKYFKRNSSGLININLNHNKLLCGCDISNLTIKYESIIPRKIESLKGVCKHKNGLQFPIYESAKLLRNKEAVDESNFEIRSISNKSDETTISCVAKGCSRFFIRSFAIIKYQYDRRLNLYKRYLERPDSTYVRNSMQFIEKSYKCSNLHKADYFVCRFDTFSKYFNTSTKKISCFSFDEQHRNQLLTFIIPVSVGTLVVFALIIVCSVSKKVYTRSRLKKFIIMLKIGRAPTGEGEAEQDVEDRPNSDSEPPEYHSEEDTNLQTVSQNCPPPPIDVIKPPSYETVEFYKNSTPPDYSAIFN